MQLPAAGLLEGIPLVMYSQGCHCATRVGNNTKESRTSKVWIWGIPSGIKILLLPLPLYEPG